MIKRFSSTILLIATLAPTALVGGCAGAVPGDDPGSSEDSGDSSSQLEPQSAPPPPDTGFTIDTGKGTCLDVQGGSTSNGAEVISYHCNGGANQKWYWAKDPTGWGHWLINYHSRKCMKVSGDFSNGRVIQQGTCSHDLYSQFETVGYNSAWLGIATRGQYGAFCLNIRGNTSADKTPIVLYSCTSQQNEKFKLPAVH